MATPTDASRDGSPAAGAADRGVVLARFYAGEMVPCPVGCGAAAEAVRVSTTESGGGLIWMECDGCAQRGRYPVPPATAAERDRVDERIAAGQEPICPRHERRTALRRRGRQLFCPGCGVRFRG
ncbi:MAG: hypothetical protein ACOC8B_03425 [Gemmatimonadota bacterium]